MRRGRDEEERRGRVCIRANSSEGPLTREGRECLRGDLLSVSPARGCDLLSLGPVRGYGAERVIYLC